MYHIIVNPIAGGRRARKNLEIVKRLLAERGVGYNVYETSGAGDAKEIAARLTARDEAGQAAEAALTQTENLRPVPLELVVVGGDGTLHHTVNGLLRLEHLPEEELRFNGVASLTDPLGRPRYTVGQSIDIQVAACDVSMGRVSFTLPPSAD